MYREFIHTFSAETYLASSHVEQMVAAYGNDFIYNHIDKKFFFCKYMEYGFRMEVVYTDNKVKQYDKEHRSYKASWIVTPAKLLYPGEPMQKLHTPEEYAQACTVLGGILDEIKKDSGVDLLREAKIRRVDVTRDIETSSEAYSKEVIRLAKKALRQYGFMGWQAESDTEKWKDENAAFFNNHNQEIHAKIYNKLADLQNYGYDTSVYTGLLRFELTLKRAYMKNTGYILDTYLTMDNLPFTLGCIVKQAHELLQKYMIKPLWPGKMLSKEKQKKQIKRYCGSRQKKYEKMMKYRRQCNRAECMADVLRNPTIEGYFKEMGMSPLYVCNDEVEEIPAFADLLEKEPSAL